MNLQFSLRKILVTSYSTNLEHVEKHFFVFKTTIWFLFGVAVLMSLTNKVIQEKPCQNKSVANQNASNQYTDSINNAKDRNPNCCAQQQVVGQNETFSRQSPTRSTVQQSNGHWHVGTTHLRKWNCRQCLRFAHVGCLEKVKNMCPNGSLMVTYHGKEWKITLNEPKGVLWQKSKNGNICISVLHAACQHCNSC